MKNNGIMEYFEEVETEEEYTTNQSDDGRGHGQVHSRTSQWIDSDTPPMQNNSGNHSRTDQISSSPTDGADKGTVLTGWESEREIFLAAERIRRNRAQKQKEMATSNPDFTSVLDGVIHDISGVVTLIDAPEPDTNKPIESQADSKLLAEERRQKEMLGIHM